MNKKNSSEHSAKFVFTVGILNFDSEETIGYLLKDLSDCVLNYSTEVIILDTGSRDRSLEVISRYKSHFKHFRVMYYHRSSFSFGMARNFLVQHAQGRYICFLSSDLRIVSKDFLPQFYNKLSIAKVVAVYGKQVAKKEHKLYYQFELYSKFWYLENARSHKENIFLSNVFACYNRDYLLHNQFIEGGGEDIYMGGQIIRDGLRIEYIPNSIVIHSHNYILIDYLNRQKEEFSNYKHFKVKLVSHKFSKFLCLFHYPTSFLNKVCLVIEIFLFYLIKIMAYLSHTFVNKHYPLLGRSYFRKHIGVIGLRGYPSLYSGFETFIAELMNGKSRCNFSYNLYCRAKFQSKIISNDNLTTISIHTPNHKYFDAIFYALKASLQSVMIGDQAILFLGIANTFFIFLNKLFGQKIIVNVDGLDWERERWNLFGKLYLKCYEKIVVKLADIIICDSKRITKYYRNKYGLRNVIYIPYGANVKERNNTALLKRFNISAKKYVHFTGRLTPENGVDELIKAFKKLNTKHKCVIIGDSVNEERYKKHLFNLVASDKRFVFTGFLQKRDYEIISSNSLAYVETKKVGGTHPSLLEAMAFKLPILSKKIIYHSEVLGDNAYYFSNVTELQLLLQKLISKQLSFSMKIKRNTRSLDREYSWKKVIPQYEKLFYRLLKA